YRLRHPQHGPVWISRDDTLVVIPGAGAAWRELDGAVPRAAESPRRATIRDFMSHPELFEGQRHWRLRDRNGRLLRDNAGNELTPEAFAAEPERHRPVLERGSGDFFDRIILDDREHGEVWIPQSNDALLVEVEWRALDGTPVALDFESPRPAAIADLRALPQLLQGVDWLLEDSAGQVLQDADGRPISARSYLADAAAHPSPWGYYDEDGRKVGLDTLLGEDHWRDHRVLVGAPRGERAMDVRALPPNPDGSPVKPFQLEVEPREILVRQGNQGSSLYGESAYFRWVRLDLPDNEAMK